MKYLLDTHVLIWGLQDSEELSAQARRLLASASQETLALSDISFLEIAMLVKKGRIKMEKPVSEVLGLVTDFISILPIDSLIATESMELDLPQGDPFDRVIVATARRYGIPLLARDRQIMDSGLAEMVW